MTHVDTMIQAVEAQRLALEYWEHRQQRYKNRHPAWVEKARASIETLQQAIDEARKQEPFGYFRAEPFGWTDCAETDAGAIALYERPSKIMKSEPSKGLK